MKILLDPIYTQDVCRCASAVKMRRCAEHMLEKRDDLYVYWLVPLGMSEEDRDWLPKHPRIRYVELPYFNDRYKEYWHASEAYRRTVSFSGELWDVDVVVTNRTHMAPFLKWSMVRPGGMLQWSKKVLLLEDMPQMTFKMFIPLSSDRTADLAALHAYLQADRTCISAYWEKKHILRIAKAYLAPASQKYLRDSIIEATHHQYAAPMLKSPEAIARTTSKEKQFTISYAGRMVNRDFVDDSFEILLKNWVFGQGEVRIILCTVSTNFGRVDHEAVKYIEVMRPQREEFWRIMREESDVGVFMSRDEDYSMAMMEPLMQGTPMVLIRAEHAVASVGEDYPFFVDSVAEGYALVRMFKANYAKMYAKFAEWSQGSFARLLEERGKSYLPAHLEQLCQEWEAAKDAATASLNNNEVVQLIAAEAGTEPFDLLDMIKALEKAKKLRNPITWKTEEQFDTSRVVFSTHFDNFRIGLLKLGFKDAGTGTGHLVRGA